MRIKLMEADRVIEEDLDSIRMKIRFPVLDEVSVMNNFPGIVFGHVDPAFHSETYAFADIVDDGVFYFRRVPDPPPMPPPVDLGHFNCRGHYVGIDLGRDESWSTDGLRSFGESAREASREVRSFGEVLDSISNNDGVGDAVTRGRGLWKKIREILCRRLNCTPDEELHKDDL